MGELGEHVRGVGERRERPHDDHPVAVDLGGDPADHELVDLVSDDHRAEVVPSGSNDLTNVDNEKYDVTDGQPEVEETRHLISAEQVREPGKLHWLVDRQTSHERAKAHDDDRGVRNSLRGVVLSLRRRLFAKTQVVQRDLNGFDE